MGCLQPLPGLRFEQSAVGICGALISPLKFFHGSQQLSAENGQAEASLPQPEQNPFQVLA